MKDLIQQLNSRIRITRNYASSEKHHKLPCGAEHEQLPRFDRIAEIRKEVVSLRKLILDEERVYEKFQVQVRDWIPPSMPT
jgi:Mg2+ and Co2+ transporter CorA